MGNSTSSNKGSKRVKQEIAGEPSEGPTEVEPSSPHISSVISSISTHSEAPSDINPTLIPSKRFTRKRNQAPPASLPLDGASRTLGVIGESQVLSLLRSGFPDYAVHLCSEVGHQGDIHMVNEAKRLRIIVEVKYKKQLTQEDITKFRSDMQAMTREYTSKLYSVFGLFVSLLSPIPHYGQLKLEHMVTWLGNEYCKPECIQLVVKQFERIAAESRVSSPAVQSPLYTLLSNLSTELNNNHHIQDHLEAQIKESEKLVAGAYRSLASLRTQEALIRFIQSEFITHAQQLDYTAVDGCIRARAEERLREYLRSIPESKQRKKDIEEQFGDELDDVKRMTLAAIRERYC